VRIPAVLRPVGRDCVQGPLAGVSRCLLKERDMGRAQLRQHGFLGRSDIADEEFRQFRDDRSASETNASQLQSHGYERAGVEPGLSENLVEFAETCLEALARSAKLAQERNRLFCALFVDTLRKSYAQVKFQCQG